MKMIHNKKIYQLKDQITKIPLSDLLSKYIAIKKSPGENDFGISPFYNDNSFNHFRINKSKNTWFDYKILKGGNIIVFIQKLFNCTDEQAVLKIINDFPELFNIKIDKNSLQDLSRLKMNPNVKLVKSVEVKHTTQSPLNLHLAYKLFLYKKNFALSDKDREILKTERHLTDKEIDDIGFISMPYPNNTNLRKLNMLLTKCGLNSNVFKDVPGFYLVNGEVRWKAYKGIGIPVRDINEHIIGIQIRVLNPAPGFPKYIWFSSASVKDKNATNKTSAGTPIGVLNQYSNSNNIIITEGFFKGYQFSKQLNATSLVLSGVGTFRRSIEDVLSETVQVKQKDIKQLNIIISYDADFIKNENVLKQEKNLARLLIDKFNIMPNILFWDQKYGKGFDDLVINHPDTFKQYLKYQSFDKFDKMMTLQKNTQ